MEAEVIVHSDFSASDRDYDSQLHGVDTEEAETEEQEPDELPSGEVAPPGSPSAQQDAGQALDGSWGDSEVQTQEEQLHSTRETPKTEAVCVPGLTNGFHRHGESLDSVESGDSDSIQECRGDVRPVKCQSLSVALEEPPLCSNSGLSSSSSASENMARVHNH